MRLCPVGKSNAAPRHAAAFDAASIGVRVAIVRVDEFVEKLRHGTLLLGRLRGQATQVLVLVLEFPVAFHEVRTLPEHKHVVV